MSQNVVRIQCLVAASPWKDFKIFNLVWVIDLEKSTSDKGSETLKVVNDCIIIIQMCWCWVFEILSTILL